MDGGDLRDVPVGQDEQEDGGDLRDIPVSQDEEGDGGDLRDVPVGPENIKEPENKGDGIKKDSEDVVNQNETKETTKDENNREADGGKPRASMRSARWKEWRGTPMENFEEECTKEETKAEVNKKNKETEDEVDEGKKNQK